ncbi:MAG: Trypsin [Verrucomicrobiales bacterium]|nr:Trypsin [Verrucomicrobiales bacterium]
MSLHYSVKILVSLLLASNVYAVQVIGTTGNTTAPVDDPGFANIGTLNGASAIYLGDRWVLTASHVGSGSVIFGGTTYTVSGPVTQLTNMGTPGMTSQTDMILFQINADPGLPSLTISPGAAAPGDDLMMIGNGTNRNSFRSFYSVVQGPGVNDDVWTAVGGPGAGVQELFLPSSGNAVRWGTNDVDSAGLNVNAGSGSVRSFATVFDDDPTGRPNEAQGVLGDSGSGVFRKDGLGNWQLLGMTHAIGSVSGYDNIPASPASSVIGDSATFVADLSFYRTQILTVIPEPGSATLAAAGLLGLLRRRRA